MPAYAAGVQDTENRQHGSDDFIGTDGKPTWEAVALFLQRNKHRLDPKHHEFIDDMAARTAWERRTDRASAQVSAFACSSSSEARSHERASRRGTVRQFLQMHHIMRELRSIPEPIPDYCSWFAFIPTDEKPIAVSRYVLGDVDRMAKDAIAAANAGHNVYVEGRTVRKELRGNKRGGLEDTLWVFALVADCDADKGKAGNITVAPTFVVATSPGNRHCWFVLAHAVTATHGKAIGDAMRASFGADQDTGVVTQCYRLAGTPNFPSRAKRARGRTAVEPTAIALEPPIAVGGHRAPRQSRDAASDQQPPNPWAVDQSDAAERRFRTTCSRSSATAPPRRRPLGSVSQGRRRPRAA